MDRERFRPAVDWSNEFVNSALWVVKAFGVAALVALVVLVLVGRLTEWGRQFWRITGKYFVGRASAPVWIALALLLLSGVLAVRISVLLSYYRQ
jgi:vitamin B12/bleomycin/antimicrobial peptide transport system ATP-binding/permease protein